MQLLIITVMAFVIAGDSYPVVDYSNDILRYETDTHSRYETGEPGRAVQGGYSFVTEDGRIYRVTYEADEKGFRAKGEYLTTPTISNGITGKIASASEPSATIPVITLASTDEEGSRRENEMVLPDTIALEIKNLPENEFLERRLEVAGEEATGDLTTEISAPPPLSFTSHLIQVPFLTKVLSLTNTNRTIKPRSSKKSAKKNNEQQIIRYRLAFQPSYNTDANKLTQLID